MTSRKRGLGTTAMDNGSLSTLCRGRRAVDGENEAAAPRDEVRGIKSVYELV